MENYIEYIATGKCNSFQNIFYTADVADMLVEINGIEIPDVDYTWVYGTKFVQFNTVPEDGDRVRLTNEALVVEPDPDLDILRNDVSANTAAINAFEAEQLIQDAVAQANTDAIVVLQNVDADHEDSINDLSTQYNTHEARLDQLDIDLTGTEAKAQQNLEDIALLSDQGSNITDLQNSMLAVEADIVSINGDIVVINNRLDSLEEDVATLNATLGSGDTAIGTNEILNNVATPASLVTSLTGQDMVVDAQYCYSARLYAEIIRSVDGEKRHVNVELLFQWDGTQWEMGRLETTAISGDSDGVTFSVVNNVPNQTGDLHYISDDMTGTNYTSSINFKLIKQPHTL